MQRPVVATDSCTVVVVDNCDVDTALTERNGADVVQHVWLDRTILTPRTAQVGS